MIEFLKGELSDFSPTVEQCLKIVEKSEGVFLYLQLTTEELNKGLYSLDKLEDLPNGINDYYYISKKSSVLSGTSGSCITNYLVVHAGDGCSTSTILF